MTTLETLPSPGESDSDEDATPDIVRRVACACVAATLASIDTYLSRVRDGPKLLKDEECQFSDLLEVVPWINKESGELILLHCLFTQNDNFLNIIWKC